MATLNSEGKANMPGHQATVDICCGVGGISLAAKDLGLNPILGVDICQKALKTYKTNLPKTDTLHADIASEDFRNKITSFLLKYKLDNTNLYIISGPPCQGFSDAGTRQADDPRNAIIIKVASLIPLLKPKAALIENVSAINHNRYQDTIDNLKHIIMQAGYHICDIELNAIDYGVSQRRRRRLFFITRNAVAETAYYGFLKRRHRKAAILDELFSGLPKARVRPDKYHDGLKNKGFYNHFAMQHSEHVKKKIAGIEPGKGPLSYRKLDPNGYAPTLISGHRAPPTHYRENRSITVREAARIQSFPDSFRICGNSGSQLQQVANAVPPKLAKAALKALIHFVE